ncbi:MAG: hypothetical protein NVS9B10_02820 [Nevskia sp.]
MNPPSFQITPAFASPIVNTMLPNPAALNRDLRALFLSREAQGERYRKQVKTPTIQVNIFESEFNLFAWPDAPIQHLRGFCLGKLAEVITQLNGYRPEDVATLKLLVDCWFHITRHGGYISGHTHPLASWSGVYCVTPGEQPPEHPDSGVLRFLDARPYANMYQDPGNAKLQMPYGPGSINYKLLPGQLILFPSYLVHEVTPFFGRDERITVAFNISLADPALSPHEHA